MDIRAVDATNAYVAWDMFGALCKEQGTEQYISADVERFCHAMCQPDAVLRGLVARDGDEYLGVVFYFFGASPYAASPFLYFMGLYIKPPCRNLGVAKALMRELSLKAVEKKCHYIRWAVVKENRRAISYYEHLGFNSDPDPLLDYTEDLDVFIKSLNA
mgnify:CR=1 FL=1